MGKEKIYAIIDVETTGGKASRDRITEIAIVRHDGQQVIDEWSSLVNPERYIPAGITELTGITQEMVADAPKFYEIAKEIVERTEGAIFVAHNARFDYSFIREEFRRLGYTYTRKNLCTVRLSRKAFPGLPGYGLGRLCEYFNITNEARHRALGDAAATAILLEKILNQEENQESAHQMINLGIKESLLPANLNLEKIHALPETCGVYYFHNQRGEVVYVGKSINIKKRVAEHFAKKTEKARKLQQHVFQVTYEETGSELVALLLESFEIKRIRPSINRAQKMRYFPYVIHTWINADGFRCFGIDKVLAKERKQLEIVSEYPKLGAAKGALERARLAYELCDHLCKSHAPKSACFHYHLKQCLGACAGQETAEIYNERADQALSYLTTIFDQDFFILDQGRTPEEQAVIQVKDGNYYGFGYLEITETVHSATDLEDFVKPYPGNPETRKLIQRFLAKPSQGYKIIKA
ncbi:MAG: exonuclease domain-containing protein [Bacteroidota bacterium]